METNDTPPAPPAEQQIVSADEILVLTREEAEIFAMYDRRLDLGLRITLAKLAAANQKREGKPRSMAAQAAAEQRAERNTRGWRTVVDKMVEKARP